MFSGQACTPITRAYHCYHEYVFTLTVNEQQSCFYCLCFNNGLPPRKKMRNTAVGNWEAVQSYPPVCLWCWMSEAHAYLSQFKSSKNVSLYLP